MEFRPCIDIHEGKVKQIVGSTLSDFSSDLSVNFESKQTSDFYSKLYKKDNLKGGHIIKLGSNNDKAALDALKAWPGGLQVGGGINSDNAKKYLEAGASHVIVTSFVFKDGVINFENLNKLVNIVGKEHLVLDLSCKEINGEYFIVTDRWQNITDVKIDKESLKLLGGYCDELLIHAASVEGKMMGPDLNLVKILGDFSPVKVTYAGGISNLGDLKNIKELGQNRVNVTVGSALDIFGGKLPYKDVVDFCKSSI
ncbi:phosphoribosylformimino-5-aminoimidazole carboxamide ribotide isomerase [Thiospirochaeta perfilievii]|uniref:Phosphoribosylformimino-5-aminoimidazole carboxamide ribotide isomerase n=1 Tax=Thiospirochaeta perfilievii TaxID=252967 RepID=A0A5C1QDE3_9SPIO|nr:phosphoribosylformimino-5-aminoimidazole carboxamide ribotide isomerase [Thiospirochaeta perfilievii]QEN04666.1 phosphoribosylformimino-5-aminoimidazole carboxamide ribotide isomerase [Thiospirochaeta perfilievii]